ncbi:MAG: 3'-5' DNA helicase [Piccolia ochrophora]|nr:MAG: 3'-5' DNA helicase [Piccolia ochrophora]
MGVDADDEDFGDLDGWDDADLIDAVGEVEANSASPPQRPAPPTTDRSLKRKRGHEYEEQQTTSKQALPAVAHNQRTVVTKSQDIGSDDDGFDPPAHDVKAEQTGRSGVFHDAQKQKSKGGVPRRSKLKVHVPKHPELPQASSPRGTGVPYSSPSRIRGPRWKRPAQSTGPPQVLTGTTGVGRAPLTPRRFQGSSNQQPSPTLEDEFDEENAFEPSPLLMKSAQRGDLPSSYLGTPSTQSQGSKVVDKELRELPSDAFASSSPPNTSRNSSNQTSYGFTRPQGVRAPIGGLRQTTLFGSAAVSSPEPEKRPNGPAKDQHESPTHHKLNHRELQSWVFPINIGSIRDYQYNIIQRGLFHNLLVALPTGLGKTFIAATVMLNWYRWTTESQIVFLAPTKPLVAQQIEACLKIVGIPRSDTTMLTGGIPPGLRAEEWSSKRVFFMTPQTMINDLKVGTCDPKKIVCVVIDEAHRATGGYSYVEVINFIRRFNSSFRVLALTATPGATVEAVQSVIDALDISKVEIRTEQSLDIRQYVHQRKTEVILFDPSPEQTQMKDSFSKALKPSLDKLNSANAYWQRDPMALTPFILNQARVTWMKSEAGRNQNQGFKGMINAIFSVLASLAHSIELLNYHGIGPFYHYLVGFRRDIKGSKYKKQIAESADFIQMMDCAHRWVSDTDFIGHPKLGHLRDVVINHFLDAGEGRGVDGQPPSATRIMVFAHFRDSAEEIVRVLKRHEPMVRAHVFVGQAGSKTGSEGMNQKTQLDVVQKFQKGVYNTLVATCVGEEGLDIGEVDLIICYDSSASPIRMLQRMGRTGRKRAGNILLLLMRGKEENSFTKSKDNYQKMQSMIALGNHFSYHDDRSARILPRDVQPVPDKRVIEIPIENSQSDLPEPRKRGKVPKRPPKKFHMPDGVQTGFVKASRLQGRGADGDSDEDDIPQPTPEEEPVAIPAIEDVLLGSADQKELERRFQNVVEAEGDQMIFAPRLDRFSASQRVLGSAKLVPHGRVTQGIVKMLTAMHDVDEQTIERLTNNLRAEDREIGTAPEPTASARARDGIEFSSGENGFDKGSDTDLEGFIVYGGEEPVPSSQSSLSTPMKPFYTAPKSTQSHGSESDDELPDVSLLVDNGPGPRQSDGGEGSEDDVRPLTKTQRRARRHVLDDSDDDDDDEDV